MTTRTDILQIRLQTDGSGKVKAELAGVEQGIQRIDKSSSLAASAGLAKLGGALAGLGFGALLAESVKLAAQFETLQARLVTVTGDAKAAAAAFDQIKQFAATTPFALTEVTDAFIKLKSLGLDPSEAALRSYGNTAAAMGRDLNQVIEAVADAATGEFERLKEFGIRASAEGDRVRFLFQGVATEVGNNADEITAYLQSIGDVQFAGAMERQAETLQGAWSNLTDATMQLGASIGNILGPVLADVARWLAEAAKEAANFVDWLGRVITFDTSALEETNAEIERTAQLVQDIERHMALVRDGALMGDAGPRARIAELKRLEDQLNQAKAAYAGAVQTQEELLESMAKTGPAATTAGNAVGGATSKVREQATAAAQLTARLRELTEFYGLSEAEAVRLEAAKAALTAATQAERKALLQAAEAYAAQLEATEEAEERSKAQAEALEFEAESWEALQAILREHQRVLADVVDSYNPLQAELRQVAEDIALLEQAVAAGTEGAEQALRNAQARQRRLLEDASEIQIDIARSTADDYTQIWSDGIDAVGDIIADGLINGFEDTGDALKQLFQQLLADLAREAIQNAIIIPIQQRILGQGGQGAPGGFFSNTVAGQAITAGFTGYSIGSSLFGGSEQNAIGGAVGGVAGQLLGTALGVFGPIGSIIGSILGAALGELFENKPEFSAGTGPEQNDFRTTSDFGVIGTNRRGETPREIAQQWGEAIRDFDNALADAFRQLGYTADEIDRVRDALANWSITLRGDDVNLENVLESRLDAIIQAIEPAFAQFLNGIEGLEERLKALEGIVVIRQQIEDLGTTLDNWDQSPIEQLRSQLEALRQDITTRRAALDAAIDANDPAAVAAATADLQAAVIRRYEVERALIQDIQRQIEAVQAAALAFEFNIARRLADTTGDRTGIIGLAGNQIGIQAEAVLNSQDTATALAHLDQFVATVDIWLQESRAQVQAWLAEQQAVINARLAALQEEEAAIYAAANARLDALRAEQAATRAAQQAEAQARAEAQQQAQAQAAAAQAAAADYWNQVRAAEQRAAQERLAVSQAWLQVMQQARQVIDAIMVSAANPIGGFGRLSISGGRIDDLTAQLQAGGGPEVAQQLIGAINERLNLAQQLFQRPSAEYLAIYNDSVRRLREIEQIADDGADLAQRGIDLQEATYSATFAISNEVPQVVRAIEEQTDLTLQLTEEEQAELARIEAERKALQEALNAAQLEAAARLRNIDDRATQYYTWAQTQNVQLRNQQQAELRSYLDVITGGLSPEGYLTQLQTQTRDLLSEIRDDLRTFLGALSTTGPGAGGSVGGGGGEGGGVGGSGGMGGDPGDTRPIRPKPGGGNQPKTMGDITLVVNVAGGDAASVAAAVQEAVRRDLPQLASQLKRELRAA